MKKRGYSVFTIINVDAHVCVRVVDVPEFSVCETHVDVRSDDVSHAHRALLACALPFLANGMSSSSRVEVRWAMLHALHRRLTAPSVLSRCAAELLDVG